ncbi:MAG: hypothetical protein HY246_06150 [Proteobacteria bacterium]|nr:hypothetical protein [Pseudomonadota bacterium]
MRVDPAAPFLVRRSRWQSGLYFAFAVLLLIFAAINLWKGLADGNLPSAAWFFAALIAFYAWHAAGQFLDRRPQIVVDAAGLLLAAASPDPIPWQHIRRATAKTGWRGRARIDLEVDPETHARLKLGQRFMGDPIVRLRGRPTGLSILTQSLDRDAQAIFVAMQRHWPADDAPPHSAARPSSTL